MSRATLIHFLCNRGNALTDLLVRKLKLRILEFYDGLGNRCVIFLLV